MSMYWKVIINTYVEVVFCFIEKISYHAGDQDKKSKQNRFTVIMLII